MSFPYAQHLNLRTTHQSQPIPGRESEMARNNAGGYAFAVDCWAQLNRFLVLGAQGGTYYVGEQQLTRENASNVLACVKQDGVRAVDAIVAVSEAGRAPKNDPAIFALALVASTGSEEAKRAAFAALPRVCRIGTHLFQFAEYANAMRGWGRGLRRAVANWYQAKGAKDLAHQVTKYQQRNGWSHRDLLRLSHPKFADHDKDLVAKWAVGKATALVVNSADHPLSPIAAFEDAKRATDAREVVRLVRDYRMPRECVPTQFLNEPCVWEALLEHMPVTAMIRNLGNMTKAGVVAPLSAGTRKVVETLTDREALKRGRVHPIALLLAQKTYASGRGFKGSNAWSPVPQVVDALNDAFYLAFEAVEPTGKRFLIGLDVSGSMDCSLVAGTNLSAREAAAALSLVTASTEKQYAVMGFSNQFVPLPISPRQRLADVISTVGRLPFGGTDCALPMLYAAQNNIPVDVFMVLTDNETWFGGIHPAQALRQYREKTGIPAKLAVVAMTATKFSIADPADGGMLDVVGMDASVPAVVRDFVVG